MQLFPNLLTTPPVYSTVRPSACYPSLRLWRSVKLINCRAATVSNALISNHRCSVGFRDLESPTKLILDLTKLDALKLSQQLDAKRSGFLLVFLNVGDGLLIVLEGHTRVRLS